MTIRHIVPRDPNTDQLGTENVQWKKVYTGELVADSASVKSLDGITITGSAWYTGEGNPPESLGGNRDCYFNSLDYGIWQHIDGAWELVVNLPGGDMLKSVYDPNDDGKVTAAATADTALAVAWGNITGKPNFADPSWKAPVTVPASLPLVGNNLQDIRIVIDDGDGKGAMYECIATVGDLAAQWRKMADVDWSGGEPTLGNPAANGYILSSSTDGTRSWVAGVLDTALTGISLSTNSPVTSSDNVLQGIGKLQAQISALTTNAQTDSYTLVLSDAGKIVEIGKATAATLTVPTNAFVAFPIGTKIDILQTGAGQVTVGGAGVTINATPGLKLSAQWAAATLVKRATDTWVLIGSLSA